MRLAEREVRPEEYGKPLSTIATGLGVRIYRNGTPVGFWEPDAKVLQPGDRIIEIVPSLEHEAALEAQPGLANYTSPHL